MRQQMHAHWIMDDTLPTQSATNDTADQWSTSHGHGHQSCRHLCSWRSCAFPPPSTLLTTNHIYPAGPCTQDQTQDIPWSHPTPHHTPSTSINSHQQRPHTTTLSRHTIYLDQPTSHPTSLSLITPYLPKKSAPPTTCFALRHWLTYTLGQCTLMALVHYRCAHFGICNTCL